MTNDGKKIWIQKGYDVFALAGHGDLKVERLAKAVDVSKSSFYHYFADLELFVEALLKYHIEQSYVIAEKERQAKNIDPELIHILIEHKTDLLFNRQLRINQHIPAFATILQQSNRIVGDSFTKVWLEDTGLKLSPRQTESIFTLALENFYLQINAENLHYDWLSTYFKNLNSLTKNLI